MRWNSNKGETMKKKLVLFLISAVLPFCCSSCGIIDIATQLSNTDSSETKISSEEEFTNYVEQQFEEKYGKEFELIGFSSPFMSISRDCDIRCVDDGIEFQATVHSKDYYEVESENYLCYKYMNEIENDVDSYVSEYFTDFKLAYFDTIGGKLSFDTDANSSYEELKDALVRDSVHFQFWVLIREDCEISEETWEKVAQDIYSRYEGNVDVNAYKSDINLFLYLSIDKVSSDFYEPLPKHINREQYYQYKNEISTT